MVAEISDQHDSAWAAISEVARLLGVGCAETVRKWVRQAQVDAGTRPGTTTEESAELNAYDERTPNYEGPTRS
jgi:transposase